MKKSESHETINYDDYGNRNILSKIDEKGVFIHYEQMSIFTHCFLRAFATYTDLNG